MPTITSPSPFSGKHRATRAPTNMSPRHKSSLERRTAHLGTAHRALRFTTKCGETGFTLVELMVGMVVSLICVLAMMAAFAAFEGPKRTTTSGDDAQQNGSYSLFELERQIRTAGSGLTQGNNYGVWGCSITAYTTNQVIPRKTAFPAAFGSWPQTIPGPMLAVPVLVAAGGTDASGNALSDTIAVVAGNPAGTVFKSAVQSSTTASTLVLDNSLGIYANDYLLATTTAGNCSLGQASAVTSASNQVTLVAANSPSTGFTSAAYVFDMGAQPVISLYGVDPNTSSLVMYDMLQRSGDTTLPVADGIVAIKALYGVDDGATNASIPGSGKLNDGIIDEWVQPTGTWSIATVTASQTAALTAFQEIKAVRLVVVARSQLPERSIDYAGAASLTLFSDLPTAVQYKITTQPQYRYKVYDTTIPIHNAIVQRWY
ncbi:PilW family protein [Dyella sp. 20L07]|uniref:PilW family protein n=1 Tax=Dyella sp. 20L07 TaxID=3384240 RepID=UPI003D2A8E6E